MDEGDRIATLEDVPADGTFLFTVRQGFDEREAILVELDDGVAAWMNYCMHWTDVRLDKGSGAAMRDGEILCQRHGAGFDSGSGVCTFGPCEGAALETIDVTVADGAVYLTDDDYEFVHVGASAEVDLSSGSRIDFSGT